MIITAQLMGGIGNQMFQIAAAKGLNVVLILISAIPNYKVMYLIHIRMIFSDQYQIKVSVI